jgi:hypothetical protein
MDSCLLGDTPMSFEYTEDRSTRQGKITDDGTHRVHSTDPVDGTVYYRNLETGDLEYIGIDGEWVEA